MQHQARVEDGTVVLCRGRMFPVSPWMRVFVVLLVSGFFCSSPAFAGPPQSDGRFITDWLIGGPFTDRPLDSLLTSLGGADAAHREGEALPDGEGAWMRYLSEGNIINLRATTDHGPGRRQTAAYCELQSEADQAGHIHCGSDNALSVWLNGNPVFNKPTTTDETLAPAIIDVQLRRGTNRCLVICSPRALWLPGFTFRVDGPSITPAPPLVWNPLVAGSDDGRYLLFSPDWKWKIGDNPAWAAPDFDDSQWDPAGPARDHDLEPGTICWLRIRAHFTPESVQARYAFATTHGLSLEIFVDGVRAAGFGALGAVFSPGRFSPSLHKLPCECVLAIRHVVESQEHLPRIGLKRADNILNDYASRHLPQRFHRFVLIALLAFLLFFYRTAFWRSPRSNEGAWYSLTLLFALLSVLVLDMDQWTSRLGPSFFRWISVAFGLAAGASSIPMAHVIIRGQAPRRLVGVLMVLSMAVYALAWSTDMLFLIFIMQGVGAVEYLRVWVLYSLRPRHHNRWYIGMGILLYFSGFGLSAAAGLWNFRFLASFCTYGHFYGIIAFMGCMLIYLAREYRQNLNELQSLNAELEGRVERRTERVRELTQQVITAQEDERGRIARELHDSVAQSLWYARIAAEDLVTAFDPDRAKQLLEMLHGAIGEVRTIAYGLRPPELDKLGFVQAVARCCKDFSYSSKITLDYEDAGMDNVCLSPDAEVHVYRVLQEALNNVQQHAKASLVRVRLLGSFPWVMLRIEDDGVGFDMGPEGTEFQGNLGVRGMRERIRVVGGSMTIQSAPGKGAQVILKAPQKRGNA